MKERGRRLLALAIVLVCAATAETASGVSRKRHKPLREHGAAPALALGVPRGVPSSEGATPAKPETITTYRNDLDQAVYSIKASHFDVSPELRSAQPTSPPVVGEAENEPPVNPELPPFRQIRSSTPDPVVQAAPPSWTSGGGFTPTTGPVTGFNFLGLTNTIYWPPDNNGSVGNDQYVETVNTRFAVWSLNRATKSATQVFGPANTNVLWGGFGGACQTQNAGDPIVIYDKLANRWLISQLTSQAVNGIYYECVALSTTANAAGSYYRWSFAVPGALLGDYPHYGVWSNAYTMMAHGFSSATGSLVYIAGIFAALDRTKMLAGDPAATWQVILDLNEAGHMPADLDGVAPPPTAAPPVFVSVHAGTMFIYRMKVDFVTPGNTGKTLQAAIPIAPWTRACPLYGSFCIPQPADDLGLVAIGDRLMFRAAYRNFVDHESLVVSHAVDPSVPGVVSGIRWYDIRLSGPADPACPEYPCVHQQGTVADAPNGRSRWMSSVAMDAGENMLLGYSTTGKTNGVENHSIRYTGRAKDDPAGTMTVPEAIVATGQANSFTSRWGDYTSMSVDPFDDCTFWYVNQYVPDVNHWFTRIASAAWPAGTGPGQCPAAACVRPSAAPAIGSATASADHRIDLSWAPTVPAPASYAIERAAGACGSEGLYQPVGAVSGAESTFTDTSVQGGVTYSYRVIAASDATGRCQALVASACTAATATGTCRLKPSFAGATSATSNDTATCGIKIGWQAAASSCPASPAMRYSVFRSTNPDFVPEAANRIATCIAGASEYLDTDNLASGVTHHYVVRAEDESSGNGGICGGNFESNTVRVSASPHGPGTQVDPGTFVDDGGDTSALLHLDPASGLSGDPVWRYVKTADDPGANHTASGAYAYRNAGPAASAQYEPYACASITTPFVTVAGTYLNLTYWERHELQYHWDGVAVEYAVNDGDWLDVPAPGNNPTPRVGCSPSDVITDWEPMTCLDPTNNACGFSGTKPAITGPLAGGSSCPEWKPNPGGPLTSYAHRCHHIVNLNPGDAIRFRWRFSSDHFNQRAGFYLDDIAITNVNIPNACTPDACSGQAAPDDVAGLSVSGQASTLLTWDAETTAVAYDVVSATLFDLRQSGTTTGTCLVNDVSGTSQADPRPDPPPGDGYYYLVRAQDACGRGTYGSDSAGAPREPSGACP